MKNTIYTIALTAATLTASPFIASDGSSMMGNMCADANFIISQETVTSKRTVDDRQYLNSAMIRRSFYERLAERDISHLSDSVEQSICKISEKCGYFNIKEVYADYSPISNAIRIDMIINNDFLLIVRKTIDEDENNNVAISLSNGNEDYLVDYIDLDYLVKEVNYCIRG